MRVRLPVVLVVVAAVVLLALALAVCVVLGPRWMVGTGAGLTAAERLRAENDIRATLLQGLGGLLALGGVALGAAMTLRQVKANREGHSIDLFTKAIDRMASEHLSVRQGGVYALERLSELDPQYRGPAHEFLQGVGRHDGTQAVPVQHRLVDHRPRCVDTRVVEQIWHSAPPHRSGSLCRTAGERYTPPCPSPPLPGSGGPITPVGAPSR